jgi:hypothetical protein
VDKKVQTKTIVLTKGDVRRALRDGALDTEEERFVRIRFGLSEPRTAILPRKLEGKNRELRAKIAMIEAMALEELGIEPTPTNPVLAHIIARLRNM